MPKFIVSETIPCLVTWKYTVEAANEDEALDRYRDGDTEATEGPFVGDSITEFYPDSTTVEREGEEEAR